MQKKTIKNKTAKKNEEIKPIKTANTKVEKIFQSFFKQNPNPTTELNYRNHFELLIAVMLSAHTTDVSVNKATPLLFQAAPHPDAMQKLGIAKIKNLIQTIGLYNTKAKNIYKTCQILTKDYKGKIPKTREELEKLPGVGVKTAAVVLNVAHSVATIPVDTHVFRVSNRLGLVQTKTPEKTEKELLKVVPEWAKTKAHHWLILHGRYTCKARKPLCYQCSISYFCPFNPKTIV